jgi:N-acetyl-anhydromuramoyl-L-alanine amidase
MPYPEFERPSPNCDSTPSNEQLGVVFHHSELGFDETIGLMLRPESKVSYHCLIAADGTRCTLVHDADIAWHAGASRFLGRERCNDFLLGVAFEGDTYRAPLTEAQLGSALDWLASRWNPRGWTLDRITDHRQISPGRKRDLKPSEWVRLQTAIAARCPFPG